MKSSLVTLVVCVFMIGLGIAPSHHMLGKILEAGFVMYGVVGLVRDRVFWFLE